MAADLNQITPPALPLAPNIIDGQYLDQLNNIQRMFYNRLTNITNALVGPNGGRYVECPSGVFFNTATQTLDAVDTAYPVEFNQTYIGNGVSLVDGSEITVSIGGVYNIQYSGQLLTTSANAKALYLWIRRNGVDIGYSTRAHLVNANNQLSDVTWNFNIDLGVGEYVQMVVAQDALSIQLEAQAASAPYPAIPSSVLSVNFVSPLPNPRPTPP